MDEKRLVLVRHQTDRNRKFVCVMNDMERSRYDTLNHTLRKECGEASFKLCQNIHPVKVLLARRRSLQKCLQIRQRANELDPHSKIFGQYDGISLDDMRHDVDNYIGANHPRLRRLREVQRLLSGGKRSGALLDNVTASQKIHTMFEKFHAEREQRLAEWREKYKVPLRYRQSWISPPVGRKSLTSSIRGSQYHNKILPAVKTSK